MASFVAIYLLLLTFFRPKAWYKYVNQILRPIYGRVYPFTSSSAGRHETLDQANGGERQITDSQNSYAPAADRKPSPERLTPEQILGAATEKPTAHTCRDFNRTYYFAAWTDSGCLLGCEHQHQNVISAANCISTAGGYVIAVETGQLRALNQKEEREFQLALYGGNIVAGRVLVFRPLRVSKPILN